jgi:plasmid stabilization system protein ParE
MRKYNIEMIEYAQDKLREVEDFSLENWGPDICFSYLDDIEKAVFDLETSPLFLRKLDNIFGNFYKYHINSHYLIYEVINETIYILTIEYEVRDLTDILAGLAPHFKAQVDKFTDNLNKS